MSQSNESDRSTVCVIDAVAWYATLRLAGQYRKLKIGNKNYTPHLLLELFPIGLVLGISSPLGSNSKKCVPFFAPCRLKHISSLQSSRSKILNASSSCYTQPFKYCAIRSIRRNDRHSRFIRTRTSKNSSHCCVRATTITISSLLISLITFKDSDKSKAFQVQPKVVMEENNNPIYLPRQVRQDVQEQGEIHTQGSHWRSRTYLPKLLSLSRLGLGCFRYIRRFRTVRNLKK